MTDFKEVLEKTRRRIDDAIKDAQEELEGHEIPELRKIILTHLIEIYSSWKDFGDCLPQRDIPLGSSLTKWVMIKKRIDDRSD